MKIKRIFGFLSIGVIIAIATINMNVNSSFKRGLSDISLSNVEALASGESGYFCCTIYPVPLVCFWLDGKAMDSGYVIYPC